MTGRALPRVLAFLSAALAVAACGQGPGEQVISRPPVAVAPIEARRIVDRILVTGELLATGVHEIAARRCSEQAGDLVVHFPREDCPVERAR